MDFRRPFKPDESLLDRVRFLDLNHLKATEAIVFRILQRHLVLEIVSRRHSPLEREEDFTNETQTASRFCRHLMLLYGGSAKSANWI